MAKHNPFRMFRKNQKAWLAGLTLFTMFSFIALGSMFQCLQVKNPGMMGDSLFATTKTLGNLDYPAFINEQDEVNRLSSFLQVAVGSMAEDGLIMNQGNYLFTFDGDSSKPEAQFPVLLENLMVLSTQLGAMTSGNTAQNLVNRWLVIQTGRKEGLAPTENNVKDYLAQLFRGKINSKHLEQALRGSGMKQDQLVGLLANQIVYEWMIRKADGGWRTDILSAMTDMPTGHGTIPSVPGEKLETGERLYRTLKADVAAFPIENYFDQIADPSEDVAKAYFEKFKNAPYSPNSAQPGFYLPTKASFEVVTGELTEERLAAVTDEEIAAYYEANKESFAKPKAPAATSNNDGPTASVEGAEEFTLPSDLESNDVVAPTESAPAEEAPAEEEKQVEETAPEANATNASPFRLVSYQEEAAPAEEAPADAPVEEAAPAEEAPADAPAEEATPAEEAPADAPVEEATPAEEASADAPVEEATPAEDTEYFTLDEVKESIRRQIATEKLTKELETIQTQMSDYSTKLANKRANVSTGEIDLPELNLTELAEKAGFTHYETTVADKDGTPAPVLLDLNEAAMTRALPAPTLYEIYSTAMMDYSPQMTNLTENKIHLYWVTELKGEHLPEFDEVRDLVIATWKKEKAISLAEKDAQALADRVKSEGKSLADLATADGDAKKYLFAKTEAFTEFELPRSFRNPSLTFCEVREEGVAPGESEIENKGIVAPGKKFYDAAYALDVNGVSTIRNQPEDRVFVLQLTERDSDDLLLEKMDGPDGKGLDAGTVRTIRLLKNLQFQEDWIEQLKADAGFEWVTFPGRYSSR